MCAFVENHFFQHWYKWVVSVAPEIEEKPEICMVTHSGTGVRTRRRGAVCKMMEVVRVAFEMLPSQFINITQIPNWTEIPPGNKQCWHGNGGLCRLQKGHPCYRINYMNCKDDPIHLSIYPGIVTCCYFAPHILHI